MNYWEINIQLIRDVKTPTRANCDSWIDFYIPNSLEDLFKAENCKYTPCDYIDEETQKLMKRSNFIFEDDRIEIKPWFWILIPSGIKMQLPLWNEIAALDLVLHNKSGICTKTWLIIWAQVIDNEYRWEIHLHLINTTPFIISIKPGQKITQWIVRWVHFRAMNTVDELSINTTRGEWGFGSTWNI